MMLYADFLDRVIDNGIAAAQRDYPNDLLKLQGAWEGFEACRGKTPDEVLVLWDQARAATEQAYRDEAIDYWRCRTREAEIEFVLNLLSAAFRLHFLSWLPTARGVLAAAEILNA